MEGHPIEPGMVDRERLAALKDEMGRLARCMPLTAPPILRVAEELDRLINKVMGVGTDK